MTVMFPTVGPGLNGVDPEVVTFRLVGASASAGQGLSGAMVSVASNSAHWVAEATYLVAGEGFLTWQGFLANMQGVLGETLVPVWSRVLPLDGRFRPMVRRDPVYLGGVPFANGSGLGVTPVARASLAADASVRDTVLTVNYLDTSGLRPGHRIGIGERLHEVMWVTNLTDTTAKIRINPPLRAAHIEDELVILDGPVCRMKFASPDQGAIPNSGRSAAERVTVRFVEAI